MNGSRVIGVRSIRAHAVVALFAVAVAGEASGQVTVFAGGGAAVPVSDFGKVAELGYLGSIGGTLELGTTGFAVAAAGFFGSNDHTIAGERSNLYGVTVLGGYTIAEAYQVRLKTWAGLGGMVHSRRSDTFPGLNSSKRGLSLTAGAGASRSVGRVSVFASALYSHGLGDLGTSSYPTELLTLSGGVAIPLQID